MTGRRRRVDLTKIDVRQVLADKMTEDELLQCRLTRAAEQLQAEHDRHGGPRPGEVRRITASLYDIAADLIHAACDLGTVTQRDS